MQDLLNADAVRCNRSQQAPIVFRVLRIDAIAVGSKFGEIRPRFHTDAWPAEPLHFVAQEDPQARPIQEHKAGAQLALLAQSP